MAASNTNPPIQKCERRTSTRTQSLCSLQGTIRVRALAPTGEGRFVEWEGWVCGNHLRWLRTYGSVELLERNDGVEIEHPRMSKLPRLWGDR